MQLATRLGSYKKFKEFTNLVDNKDVPIFLRDFLDFRRNPISIDKVEPVENIMASGQKIAEEIDAYLNNHK